MNNPFIKRGALLPVASLNMIYEKVNNGQLTNYDDINAYSENIFRLIRTLKLKEYRIKHDKWGSAHWDYWNSIEEIILVGGAIDKESGVKMLQMIQKKLEANNVDVNVISSDYSSEVSVIGLLKKMSTVTESGFAFDFGHTYIKRGLLKKENSENNLTLLSSINSLHTEWEGDDYNSLHNYMLEIIVSTVCEYTDYIYKETLYVYISVANYVDEYGKLNARAGYGKLLNVDNDYRVYLEHCLSERFNRKVLLSFYHDTTAATFAFSSKSSDVAVISLGTSLGVGFVQDNNVKQNKNNVIYNII